MSKKIEELLPSDKVMIEFGPRTQFNADSRQLDTIEPGKTMDLPYGYFLSATQDPEGNLLDEYDERTGYVKSIGRTVKLVGIAGYEDETTERGDTISVAKVGEFATDASRAAAKAAADKAQKDKEKADAEADKKAKEAEKAQADFEAKQAKDAEAEQQKREVVQKAGDLVANKTPGEAKAIANAITESTDKVQQGIDDSEQASAPVTKAVAKTQA